MPENVLDNLLPEQLDILFQIVEAYNATPAEKRCPFIVVGVGNQPKDIILYNSYRIEALMEDINALAIQHLLQASYEKGKIKSFSITKSALDNYNLAKKIQTQDLTRIEMDLLNYLNDNVFKNKYSKAFVRWTKAAELLKDDKVEEQTTVIGHLCREAIEEFATSVILEVNPENVDPDVGHTKNRIKAVLLLNKSKWGDTKKIFLDALCDYWDAISDLIVRQEHGNRSENKSLTWEDSRRVVFQTAIVMFEVSRALSVK